MASAYGTIGIWLNQLGATTNNFLLNLLSTRKYLWNTSRPQPPPNSKGYGILSIINTFLWKPLFLANLITSGRVFYTDIVKRHIYVSFKITKSLGPSARKFWPVQAQVSKKKKRYFWLFWPKWSKGTFTDQDLPLKPITKSLGPSVQKFWPIQKSMTDRRTDTPNL